jgi:hypothetical protein
VQGPLFSPKFQILMAARARYRVQFDEQRQRLGRELGPTRAVYDPAVSRHGAPLAVGPLT